MEIVSGQRVMEIDRGEGGEEGQEYGSGSAYEAHVAQGGDTSPATIDVWILGEWDTYVLNGFLFATHVCCSFGHTCYICYMVTVFPTV